MFTIHPQIADSGLTDPRFIHPNAKLPASYVTLCQKTNGGFLQRFWLPTSEPTSDGLDHVECHYIAGLATEYQPVIDCSDFPAYLIPFSQHQTQYFAFDYQQNPTNPSIRYIDTEVDQWLTVADSFEIFLAQLGTKAIDLSGIDEFPLTPLQRNHYLLVAHPSELTTLLEHYESDSPKDWFLSWLQFFVQHGTLAQQKCALAAFNTQQLYFRRQLPPTLATDLQHAFKQLPALATLYDQYAAKWSFTY